MIAQAQMNNEIQRIIKNALREDIGDGDHSTLACIPASNKGKAKLLAKDEGIVAGVEFARNIFTHIDPNIILNIKINDGETITHGDVVFHVEGSSQAILQAERLVLNAMQRMSAIATKTRNFVKLLEGTSTRLLDTRKTTPGIRALEKWAVKIGGGENHRFGLYDMIMLKDNHIDFAGGITKAIDQIKAYLKTHHKSLKIIVEARSLKEVEEILEHDGIYRILLDNFNYEDTKRAVAMIGNRCLTESSGGIDEKTIRKYADCGVDYVSLGILTYAIRNMDLSLKAF